MARLHEHFRREGYLVLLHVRLNIAYSSILSDVDVLLVKENEISVIEVKSRRDKLSKAFTQLDRIKDYVDFTYVATDKRPRKWMKRNVGLILVEDSGVSTVKPARRLTGHPRDKTVLSFQKKCIERTLNVHSIQTHSKETKLAMTTKMIENIPPRLLRTHLKEIAVCSCLCDTNCPIWTFDKNETNQDDNQWIIGLS